MRMSAGAHQILLSIQTDTCTYASAPPNNLITAMEESSWKSSLLKYRSKLRTGCQVANVLPALRPLFTDKEYSSVEDKPDNSSRVDELVSVLLAKDKSTFEGFCSALETNGYPLWAKLLKAKESSASQGSSLESHPSSPGKMSTTDAVAKPKAKPAISSIEVSTATVSGRVWSGSLTTIWSYLIKLIQKMKGDCQVFGVLVVGETGTGKSTLINNLVGKDVVEVGHTYTSETATITELTVTVEGVPVALYDTPGLGDSRGDKDATYLQQVKSILDSGKVHLVIYCTKLSETRMRASLIRTFQEYHQIGVKWEQTVIALTFADFVPIPKQMKKQEDFRMDRFFNNRVAELCLIITDVLETRVGVTPEVAKNVKCYPSTSDTDEPLVNGEDWYLPLWMDILNLLSPGAAARFLEIHAKNIEFSSTDKVMVDSTAPPKPSRGNRTPVPAVNSESVLLTPSPPEHNTVADCTSSRCSGRVSPHKPNATTPQNHSECVPPTPVPQNQSTVADGTSSGCSDRKSSGGLLATTSQSYSESDSPTSSPESDSHAKTRAIRIDAVGESRLMDIIFKKFAKLAETIKSWFSWKKGNE